jgi:hypothetical protein
MLVEIDQYIANTSRYKSGFFEAKCNFYRIDASEFGLSVDFLKE